MVYFVEKAGVYSHGVWWIGDDRDEGIKECKHWAKLDSDNYHEWWLCEFSRPTPGNVDPDHLIIFKTKKG